MFFLHSVKKFLANVNGLGMVYWGREHESLKNYKKTNYHPCHWGRWPSHSIVWRIKHKNYQEHCRQKSNLPGILAPHDKNKSSNLLTTTKNWKKKSVSQHAHFEGLSLKKCLVRIFSHVKVWLVILFSSHFWSDAKSKKKNTHKKKEPYIVL